MTKKLEGLSIRESSRYKLLVEQLKQIGWTGKPDSPRILVFTEYRETQDALAEALAKDFKITPFTTKFEDQATQVIATVNGSCPDIHFMKIVEAFGTGSANMRMLVATDAASEGVNLHHECHNVIHYDLPWSIITLVQRNGRIDRIGQRISPVLRYLNVDTQNGLLSGDRAIFERLIEKVEEINKTRQQGESVLKIYDAEGEEKFIAEEGVIAGNAQVFDAAVGSKDPEATALEELLSSASPSVDDDFLDFLLGDESKAPALTASKEEQPGTRLRLFSDRDFLRDGYRYLAEQSDANYVPLEEHQAMTVLTAPQDLRRRLGAASGPGEVIFGATAIPSESWPENNQFG